MVSSSEDPSLYRLEFCKPLHVISTEDCLSGNFLKSRISRHSRYFLGENSDKYCLKMEIPPYHFYFLYFNIAFQGSDKINILFLFCLFCFCFYFIYFIDNSRLHFICKKQRSDYSQSCIYYRIIQNL